MTGGERCSDEASDEGVRGAGGQPEPPGHEVPDDSTEERRDDGFCCDELRFDESGSDGFCDSGTDHRAAEVCDGGEQDGLAGVEHPRGDDGGDGVGGIVEAVDVLEDERNQDDREEDGHGP